MDVLFAEEHTLKTSQRSLALSRVILITLCYTGILSQVSRPQVVITQLYGGGGATTGLPSFRNDYVEIFNRGTATVDLSGSSVQYAPATGSTWSVTPLSGSLTPGQYYLVQEAGGSLGSILPTPDAIGTIAMSATNGKVALVASTAALTGGCPNSSAVLDLVGYGTASCFEGAGAAAPLSTTLAAVRIDDGCNDTDDNATDFVAGPPFPRNSSYTTHPCGTVPIRLSYFRGSFNLSGNAVDLSWGTLSEINNYGFQVQKRAGSEGIYRLLQESFIPGHGTTLIPQHYSFSDSAAMPGDWLYRLEQIDLDGTSHFSEAISVQSLTGTDEWTAPHEPSTFRCYPNPFNPTTTVKFRLTGRNRTTLRIFDTLGRVVATLIDDELLAGDHSATWNASASSSGIYFCRLETAGHVQTTKLVLLR